ncbi:glycoside hydrolase family 97 C-terminal domain-containing protein [Streptacidiphilus sp. EB103A]|uniref:glycoside hydrolase family 97 C-terminal domain-containing protein n=1 Tax=Streptacidiphilus sp. EB103A TaxID=3156275 RepID=UPI003518D36F
MQPQSLDDSSSRNETARPLSVPLSFLGSGNYTATIYADGTPGASPYATLVVVRSQTVTSTTALSMALAGAGGQAVVLEPTS